MRKIPLLLAVGLLPAALACPAGAASHKAAAETATASPAVAAANPALSVTGPSASEVVARVGGADLTAEDIRAYLDTLPPAERDALGQDPTKIGQVVRLYLAQRLLLKEALDKKFDQQPETRAQLNRVRDAAVVELYLASVVQVPADFPSDAEVQAAYDANKSAFLVPRQYRQAQIFIKASQDDRTKLDAVRARLKEKGADFGAVAAQLSDVRAEAEKGGEIGWVAESQIVPEIRQVASGLAKGAVSEPVYAESGWHIVRLLDTRPAGIAPLADIRPALVARLRQARAQQLRQAYLGQLLQKDPPVLNEMALSKITIKP
jgi:peptidylprolyl isomerase